MKPFRNFQNSTDLGKRARRFVAALFCFSALSLGYGCSLMKERPVQLMSDTVAALRAAKEVNAETLAPDLYRRATDAYFRAQNEYRMKNFAIAETYANRAKLLAEEAEFEALKQGSSRISLLPPDEPVSPLPPSEISPPEGVLATEAMRHEAQQGAATPGMTPMTGSSPSPTGGGASISTTPPGLTPTNSTNFTP